jgi:FkbM family methyltransferase
MNRRGIRGSWRLLNSQKKLGLLDEPVVFPLGNGISIEVPIARYFFDAIDLLDYEADTIATLKTFIAKLDAPVTLIDGGADMGLFSLKVASLCPAVQRIVAFEPNSDTFSNLQRNLGHLSIPTEAHPQALSDFEGWGELRASDDDNDHTGKYLAESPTGKVQVTTMDSAFRGPAPNLVVKLDIEGGELSALRGGKHTIASAERVVVVFEAHPTVLRRTGVDPVECLRALSLWRPFRFIVAENPSLEVSPERPLFEQLVPDRHYNIIGFSANVPRPNL